MALVRFNKILDAHPKSPRALFGKANCLDQLADKERSNELLRKSIDVYLKILNMEDVPDILYQQAAERCINRMRFIGFYGRAISVHNLLIRRFPDEIKFRNQLSITYLTVNKIKEARSLLVDTLRRWPDDGVALVHYGFILKVSDNNLKEGMKYLAKGLNTKAEGVVDGRFYFHLGDALTRLGKLKQAQDVFIDGVANKVFLSLYQRSLYNVNRLTGKPWWSIGDLPRYQQFFKSLEANYKLIRNEGTNALNGKGSFQDEAENLRDKGDWKQLELYARGVKNKDNCKRCPFTCKLVESLSDATGCRRGQIKFSVMHPGTHVWPHCGPTNCRLRAHLGLVVPPKTYIRVAQETRSWREGKVLIFDDSFEHEVWHNGTDFRLVLIVDTWHPELTVKEKRTLSSI